MTYAFCGYIHKKDLSIHIPMLNRTKKAYAKFRERGFHWLLQRIQQEFRLPGTPLGKMMQPLHKKVYLGFQTYFQPKAHTITSPIPLIADTLCLFYDLEVSPITFDFCWILSMAEVKRKKMGLSYLYIVFVPGPQNGLREEMPEYEKVVDQHARQFRIQHILHPMLQLVPACSGFVHAPNREMAEKLRLAMQPYIYPEQYHTEFPIGFDSFYEVAHQKTQEAFIFRSTKQAKHYVQEWLKVRANNRRVIVITLRYYPYSLERNSNIEAWAKFAQSLDPKQYFVVIVPDTEQAMQFPFDELKQFEHFLPACFDLGLRSALYECCYLNLGINNGPFLLCWFNEKCRYIMYKILTPNVEVTTSDHLKMHGYTPGDPHPFQNPLQKWVWEQDNEEVIAREFHKMCHYIENTQ